jgi:cardiolipin synthase A/B
MEINASYEEIILKDEEYFSSLLLAIKKAQYTIDFEVYIFDNSAAGMKLADTLCEAAQNGVKIRVLVDGVGTTDWSNKISTAMEKAGIATRVYHPLPWIIKQWNHANFPSHSITQLLYNLFSKMNSRNHRKLCIIDSHIVYIGSANITDHLLKVDNNENIWRETTVKLIGVNTDTLQYAFERAWGNLSLKKRLYGTFMKFNPQPIFLLNYSKRLKLLLYRALLKRISDCQQRIWVANAYFVPNIRLLVRLINAKTTGVDVRILLPSKSDVFIASVATKTFYYILLKNEVDVYEYLPSILHEKILILDDWFLVGSSNLNYRSFKHDLEVDVNIRSKEAKTTIEEQYLLDLSQSKKISLNDVKKQPIFQYLLGRLVLFMRYWI